MPLLVDILTEDEIDGFVRGDLSDEETVLVAQAIWSDPKAVQMWRRAKADRGERKKSKRHAQRCEQSPPWKEGEE